MARRTTPLELPDDPEEWQDRQPGETDKAYAAYLTFRDLGPARTILKATRQHYGDEKLEKNTGKYRYMQEMSRLNRWVERAGQHDSELAAIGRLEQIEAVKAMQRRHATAATIAISKAVQRLQHMSPAEMSPRDAIVFLETATKVERLSRGEPDHVTAVSGPNGGPVLVGIGEHLTRERMAELLLRDVPSLDDEDDADRDHEE